MTVVVTHTTPADGTFSATGAAAWNADHALAGVGTMAEQDANNVAITGGNINNTVIGNTTPNAATFTTLTATGQTSLGGAAGAEGLRVVTTASAARYLIAQGATSSGSPALSASAGALVMSGGSGSPLALYTNNFAQEQLRIAHTASAVNFVQVTGATTAGRPIISAQGSDASIGLGYTAKGAGALHVFGNGDGVQLVLSSPSATTANRVNIASSITGQAVVVSATGSDTNIPLVVQPKGTGALQAQLNDGTATGGNARGANAVDWQMVRGLAGQVANGTVAVIGGGQNNTSSGLLTTVAGGFNNNASGNSAFIGGGQFNVASQIRGVVVGGGANTAAGVYNFVGGGFTNTGTANGAVTTQSATMNGTTAVTLSGSNASIRVGQYIGGTSISADTYVAAISGTSLTLSQAASGSSTSTLSFFTPHGVVVGGGNNQATGAYSFIGGGGDAGTAGNRNVASGDWSTVAGGRRNTASGQGSFVGGGGYEGSSVAPNTASGGGSCVLGGVNNIASGYLSSVVGGNLNAANSAYGSVLGGAAGNTRGAHGYTVLSSTVAIAFASGVSQTALIVLARQTTDATATVITSDGNAASTTNQVILPNNSAYSFRGTVIANVTGAGNTKSWAIEGAIKRGANAGSTVLVGTPTVTSAYADAGAATWGITATADTTNGGLAITFTGQAGTTIRVVAKLETTEVTF